MYPSILNTFTRPSTSDRLNNPSHSALHNTVSSALGQVEAFLGQEGDSSTVGTLVYDVRSPASGGGGHVQTAVKGGTGQTTYTKGDILVAQSASVLSKLSVGANDQVLIAASGQTSGIKWGAVPAIVVSSTIALSSVWTKPTAATTTSRVFVQLWGGGGSGAAGGAGECPAGGGGGGYTEGWFQASVLSSSVIVNVGRGGNSRNSGDGLGGSNTVFDVQSSILTAYGGGGGDTSGTAGVGGGGGTPLGAGQDGSSGGKAGGNTFFSSIFGGNGGAGSASVVVAMYGGGGVGSDDSAIGTPSFAIYGGGGGGGANSSMLTAGSVSRLGGNGGSGSIIGAGTGSAMGGSIPGGGGGAMHGSGTAASSGQGGHGKVIITTFL